MSDPAEVVRAMIEALDAGDRGAVERLVSPAFVKRTKLIDHPVGREEWLAVHDRLQSAVPDLRHNILELTAEGERVNLSLSMSGTQTGTLELPELGITLAPTGRSFRLPPQSDVFVVRDGVVVEGESDIPPGAGVRGLIDQLQAPESEERA